MFVCPRCRERLVRKKTGHGVFFVCPGCGGRAVSLAVLRKMAGRETTRELWRRAIDQGTQPGIDCPICYRATGEVPLPVEGRKLHLDACTGCHFAWFDPKELEQLPEPPAPAEEKPLPPEIREDLAVARAETAAKQVEPEDHPYWGPAEKWKWIPGVLGMPVECEAAAVRGIPWATWMLAAALVGVFALTFDNLEDAVGRFGLVPAEAWRDGGLTLLTSFFLHAGLLHLIANTYFLLIFGDNVEDYLGRWRYVFLLAAAAAVGEAAHVLGDPRSTVPCIGASGGVSGVITFYALRFPEARLGIMLRYFIIFRWFYMPAWVALILWFLLQFVTMFAPMFVEISGMTDVAVLAHLGGAAVGVAAWIAWRKR